MIKIDQELVGKIQAQAKQSPRLRMNYNFHKSPEETMHRMLNAMEPNTYVRPHKHQNPDKNEAFIILSGTIAVVEFDDEGNITQLNILDRSQGVYGVELPPRTYHSLISLEEGSVVYEVKDGPYDVSNDKNFAPWAPEENSAEANAYLEKLIKKLNLSNYAVKST
jgi:cupin fold WbuC family metalloprotein